MSFDELFAHEGVLNVHFLWACFDSFYIIYSSLG